MQFPITIGLRRSRFMDFGLLFVALLASVAALAFPQTTIIQLGICAVTWVAAGLAWRQLTPKFSAIRLERSGLVFVALSGKSEFLAAEILPGATVHPWMTVVKLKTEEARSHALIVTVDSLNLQNFRRLRVFLRWQAEFSAPNDAAA